MATKRRGPTALPSGVTRLHDEIERWRQTRARRTAMPAPLWTRAVALARQVGRPYAVARALRIDYESLQRRMAERSARSAPKARPGTGSTFVEMTGADLLAGPAAAGGPIVEISDATARVRVTVRLARATDLDFSRLISAVRSRGDE
jgi:hypothetical protein